MDESIVPRLHDIAHDPDDHTKQGNQEGAILVTLKKSIVDKVTCLTTTVQPPGQLRCHTNISMLLTQVPYSFTPILYSRPTLPALLHHIFE